ncbi:MAG: hypothetical protein U0Y68_12910 [Blastocatellia bacterium]
METQIIHQQFRQALDALMAQLRADKTILAAILCGSLSHDRVWAKSDVDLVLVTMDEKKAEAEGLSLNADGVNVHALLLARTALRQSVEGALSNSFLHSFLAKGQLLYTHDPTIAELLARLQTRGKRDTQVQLLRAATNALPPLYKAHKFFLTRGDLEYTALWMLATATPLAQVEVMRAGLLVDREVIPQALALNPNFFRTIYTDLLNTKKTRKNVQAALAALDQYLAERAPALFAPVLDHLRDVGEVRSATEIEDYFRRNFNVEGVTTACEYLADQGLLGKAATPVRLTRKSNIAVQELAFFYSEHRA